MSDEEGSVYAYVRNNKCDYGMDLDQSSDLIESDEYAYEVISRDKILNYLNDKIEEVNSVLGIGKTTTRFLLNYVKWDTNTLYDKYYDGEEKLFAQAGVIMPFNNNNVEMQVYPDDHKETCTICYSEVLSSIMKNLECGHRLCRKCWCEYLTHKIMDEDIGLGIICPTHKCDCLIDDETVLSLVPDPRTQQKFRYLIINSLVECNPLFRWCPATDCNNAIKVRKVECRPVTCNCEHTFCFCCSENWHEPLQCYIFKKWIKKSEDDSATRNWISANTKECPKCYGPIERSMGCNKMTCEYQNCKWNFCWVCLGPWKIHTDSYHCNHINDLDATAARDAQEKSRADLQRYLFYDNHYKNHMQSFTSEHKLYEKIEALARQHYRWAEIGKPAVDTLRQCRQTLMYTYVFAYYVKKTNQSVIFEDNQLDLESTTESLSAYLKSQITSNNLAKIQQKIQDLSRYCECRRKVLVDHVHEGYEKGWWGVQNAANKNEL